MSFSIINSRVSASHYLKVYLALLVAWGGIPTVISALVFIVNPLWFYYQPWEYFDEVAYRVPTVPMQWKGKVSGNLSRDNLIFFQETHEMTLNTDPDGFRVTPIHSDAYPIVVSGDSTIYGSGLNDQETLPWRLAELVGVPVFNGGRSPLFNVLKKPDLAQVQLVIDCTIERNIHRERVFYAEYPSTRYLPLAKDNMDRLTLILEVPFERYSIAHLLMRTSKRFTNDVIDYVNDAHNVEYKFLTHSMTQEKLDGVLATIVQRAQILKKRGIEYLYVPIPSKQTIYKEDVDEFTRQYIPILVKELKKLGVNAIDLTQPFLDRKDEGLYLPYDTHWNKKGAEIAAKVVAQQVTSIPRVF